ncbi:MAG: hypothetical protein H7A53_11635 [Akkermansiaceae bacterium]|nr:hypothetical protein [Akkermansiaceae bacterium]
MTAPMTTPFPSRDELRRSGIRKDAIDGLYEIWCHAHAEAMVLAEELFDVFGDPPRPLVTLHVARGYDDEWFLSKERGEELAAMDKESHWYEVTNEQCANFQEYFTFSDPEGWRFYMPAFLRHYLSEFPLCHRPAVHDACVTRRFFDLFSDRQIAYIDRFLKLCRTWED